MAKHDEAVGDGEKKRKADMDAGQSGSKKARREPWSPKVVLPHSPGGRVHNEQSTAEATTEDEHTHASNAQAAAGSQQPPMDAQATPDAHPDASAVGEENSKAAKRRRQRKGRMGPPSQPDLPQKQEEGTKKRNRKPKAKRDRRRSRGDLQEGDREADLSEDAQPAAEQFEQELADAQPTAQQLEAEQDAARKQIRRDEKRARRAAQRAENAEAFGDAKLDMEVDDVDATTLMERANVEAESLGLTRADWLLSSPAGGRFIDHDPIFAKDPTTSEDVLIAATRQQVFVLSLASSLVLRASPASESRSISCFTLNDSQDHLLVVACDDNTGFRWDWTSDTAVLERHKTRPTVEALACSAVEGEGEVMASIGNSGGGSTVDAGKSSYKTVSHLHSLQILGAAEYIVACGPSALVLGKRDDRQETSGYVWTEIPISVPATCVDALLTRNESAGKKRQAKLSLAVANVEGKIHLYDDIATVFAGKAHVKFPTPRILHWHREAVSAVKFSRDGNYLISGGKETVLVLWQLETGKKQYLPHLTSEIERIVVSPEGDKYAVQMGDNSIMVLSTSELKPVANFAGLQLACPVNLGKKAARQNKGIAAAVLHPQQNNQLLLTVPASQPKVAGEAAEARPFLQTFDLRASRHMTRQALTRNNATDFNLGPDKTPIASPDVAHVAISHDGQWLATVDEWMPPALDVEYLASSPDGVHGERHKRREVHLKIWQWDDVQGLWTLSTRVDAPHLRPRGQKQGAGRVFALLADPHTVGFATVGEDSRVRSWKPRARVQHGVVVKSDEGLELVEWVCKRTVEMPSETERADSPMNAGEAEGPVKACLAYSEDGSVLAAAQSFIDSRESDIVHFIDASSGEIKTTKSGLTAGSIASMGFLDRYFIAASRHNVHVWDLVTDSLHQRFGLPDGRPQLAINHADGTWAVAIRSRVIIYKPAEKKFVHADDCRASIEAVLTGRGMNGYTLLFEDATVRSLSPSAAQRRRPLPPTVPESPAVTPGTPLALGMHESEAADVEMADGLALPSADKREGRLVFEVAEDDRRVVRPEQLSNNFDVGQSFAMPPMHDMLEAIVGLFGRARVTEVVG